MCPQGQIEKLSHLRSGLLAQMQELEQQNLNCTGCLAPCCTFHHNSMRISNSEGVVLVNYLVSQKIDLSHVKKKCQATIQEFRLDKDIFVKAGTRLRRHYTCPFFTDHQLGCSIPPEFKPLGCLAFNPTEPLGKGQTCKSIAYPEFKDGEKLEIPLMILKALENILRVF